MLSIVHLTPLLTVLMSTVSCTDPARNLRERTKVEMVTFKINIPGFKLSRKRHKKNKLALNGQTPSAEIELMNGPIGIGLTPRDTSICCEIRYNFRTQLMLMKPILTILFFFLLIRQWICSAFRHNQGVRISQRSEIELRSRLHVGQNNNPMGPKSLSGYRHCVDDRIILRKNVILICVRILDITCSGVSSLIPLSKETLKISSEFLSLAHWLKQLILSPIISISQAPTTENFSLH